MKFIKSAFLILSILLIGFSLTSCTKDDDPILEELVFDPNNPEIPKVVFTTEYKDIDDFRFFVFHSDEISVDLGNDERQIYPSNNNKYSLISGNIKNGVVKIYSKKSQAIVGIDLNLKRIKKVDLKNAVNLKTVNLFGNKISEINFSTNQNLKEINIAENKFETLDLDAALNTLHNNNSSENPGTIIIGDGYDGNEKPSEDALKIAKQKHWIVDQK